MSFTVELKQNDNAVNFYLGNEFLGTLNHDDGYLSDFRAIVRKNNQSLAKDIYKTLRFSLFELLNHYLKNRLFYTEEQVLSKKNDIVKSNDSILKSFEFVIGELAKDD